MLSTAQSNPDSLLRMLDFMHLLVMQRRATGLFLQREHVGGRAVRAITAYVKATNMPCGN